MSSRRFYAGAALALWLALALRTANLYSLPLYHDEGDHLRWAQFFELGTPTYPIFMDGKFLLGVTLAQLQVYGPESIWVARAGVSIFSMLACASAIAIGKLLGGRRLALAAGFVYALLPLAAFYEHQIIADSLMAAYGAVAAALALKVAVTRQRRWAAALGLALALSFLSKFFGILFFAFPFFAIFLFAASRREFFWNVRYYVLAMGVAVVVAAIFLGAMQPMLGYNNNLMAQQQVGHVTCPPLLCKGDWEKQWSNYAGAARSLSQIAPVYMGWPLLALAALSLPLAPANRRRRVGLILIAEVAMLLAFASAAYALPARYLPFLSLPVSVLGAAGAVWLIERFGDWRVQWSVASVLVLLNAGTILNTVMLVTNPAQATMPYDDTVNYFTGIISGPGLLEAKNAIMAREAGSPIPPVIIVSHRWREQLNATLVHFDVRQVTAIKSDDVSIREVGNWLASGTPVYVVDVFPADHEPSLDDDGVYTGLAAEEIARYPREGEQAYLWVRHITGPKPELLPKLFAEFFIRPNEIPSIYQSMVDSLPADKDLALVVYPPSQAEVLSPLLASRPRVTLYPIGNSWPLDLEAAQAELAEITAKHVEVRAAFLEETKGDPNRQLETWLNTHLYRLSETWFEPVRLLEYVGNTGEGQTVANSIAFGDGITLQSVTLLDPTPSAGGLVRLRLEWQAAAPMTTQYKIFVHLFAGDKIIAQHDGQAMGELRPTNTWQAGETIVDQFAIQLPPDAPPGDYQLRIGLYDLASGARLPLASGEEFWVGGSLTIQ